jgi:hypothetical protein
MKLTGENRRTRGRTCPSATLSTKNPTWNDPESNPGLRGRRPAANRLSHGRAFNKHILGLRNSHSCRGTLRLLKFQKSKMAVAVRPRYSEHCNLLLFCIDRPYFKTSKLKLRHDGGRRKRFETGMKQYITRTGRFLSALLHV